MPKNEVAMSQGSEVAKAEQPMMFYEYAVKEYSKQTVSDGISDYQARLLQGYQVGISRALAIAEDSRVNKNASNTDHKYDNNVPVTWQNVNMNQLATDIINFSKMGLDMMQPNMLNAIPMKNKKTQKYDVVFIKGYGGIQFISEKYAIEKPVNVTCELVYSTDAFKPIKKSYGNDVESYEFEITNPFNRGEIIGGFGYIEYQDPRKNKLVIMTLHDMDKRKPQYASAEFWGGTKTVTKNGKKETVEVEGWKDEMYMKTLKREVYSPKNIPIDPAKIDDSYQFIKSAEMRYVELENQAAIEENANREEFVLPDNEEKQEAQKEQPNEQLKESKAKKKEEVVIDDSEPDWME